MTTDEERDEAGIFNELPPSYQNLLRYENNFDVTQNRNYENNFDVTQNRNYSNCNLCESCHSQSRQTIRLLNKLCNILESFDVNVVFHSSIRLILFILLVSCYLLYWWLSSAVNGPTDKIHTLNEKVCADDNVKP